MSDLILDSLEIKNFRLFKHLEIERLGRVNLIVGKNGVGKTALLEGRKANLFYLGWTPDNTPYLHRKTTSRRYTP